MKALLGILLVAAGFALGAYMGVWVCFIGGIVGVIRVIIDLAHGLPFEAALLGFSILKFMCSAIVGYLSMSVLVIPGLILIERS